MNVTTQPFADLDADQIRTWSRLQALDPDTDSPFLSPGFSRAVSVCRSDVEVAVLGDGGRSVGFLPFHRTEPRLGRPVGIRLSDLQGVIVEPGIDWNPEQLLRGAGLSSWRFDHLLVSQKPLQRYHYGAVPSPYIDLSHGFDAYVAERRHAGSEQLTQIMRKARKLEREVGPIRFEWHTTERSVFRFLVDLKSAQRRQTSTFDVLRVDWVIQLLEQLRAAPFDDVEGVLSAMFVGERLAAAHLGLRNRHTLHLWFPTFDPTMNKYSPGLVMILELIKACDAQGIRRFHLGKGMQQFKLGLMTDSIPIATGSVTGDRLSWTFSKASHRARGWLGASPLRRVFYLPDRMMRNWRHRAAMR